MKEGSRIPSNPVPDPAARRPKSPDSLSAATARAEAAEARVKRLEEALGKIEANASRMAANRSDLWERGLWKACAKSARAVLEEGEK